MICLLSITSFLKSRQKFRVFWMISNNQNCRTMKTKYILLLTTFLISSCSYYRVMPKENYEAQSIHQFHKDGKCLILHRGEMAWRIEDLDVVDENYQMTLNIYLGYMIDHLKSKDNRLHKYSKRNEPEAGNSIHLYTSDTTFGDWDPIVVIPASSIYEVKSYDYARAPSRASIFIPAILIPAAAIGTMIILSSSIGLFMIYSAVI